MWPGWSKVSVTGARLTYVPLVEPKSLMTACSFSSTMWQCELETEESSSVKSLAGLRPSEFVPALSLISQAAGEPGWTTSLAIFKSQSCALNLGILNLIPS